MLTWRIDRRTGIVALGLGVILLASNLALLKQNIELKSRVRLLSTATYLQPGETVPPLRGIGLAGEEVVIRYGPGAPTTVLLVFSPHCSWCRRNMPNWEALAKTARARDWRLVAVSTLPSEVAEYAVRYPFLRRIPIVAEIDPQDQLAYKLQGTPQTIVVSGYGVVERTWIGALRAEQEADAERFFATELPGTSLPAPRPADG
jgi:hypothetical protein